MRPGATRVSATLAVTSKERPALVLERRVMRAMVVTLIAVSLGLLTPASAAATAQPEATDPLLVVDDSC
jgi:hypothetical protein